MNAIGGSAWSYKNLNFEGVSISGVRTAISMPQYGLSFDVAQGLPFTLRQKRFFISHGHMDHAAGIPYIISQKALLSEPPAQFFVPVSLREPLMEIMRIWEKIEGHQYQYEIHEVSPGDKIELNAQTLVRPFRTLHRVRSQGYTLYHRNKKLLPEFISLSEREIRDLSARGVAVSSEVEMPLVSFTGDTQSEVLSLSPEALRAQVLFMECTYYDGRKSVEHARKWGHTHLDELIPRLAEIPAEKIILIHPSSRYSPAEARKLLAERIPAEFRDRVELIPNI